MLAEGEFDNIAGRRIGREDSVTGGLFRFTRPPTENYFRRRRWPAANWIWARLGRDVVARGGARPQGEDASKPGSRPMPWHVGLFYV